MESVVCPKCGTRSPVRLQPGEACAACVSEDAWAHWEREGKLVIDRDAIAAVEARFRRAAVRKTLGHGAAAAAVTIAVALASLSVYLVVQHLAPRPVGPPSALAGDLRASVARLVVCGVACLAVGIASLRLPPPRRARLAFRAGSIAAAVAGGGAAIFGGLSSLVTASLPGFDHLSMPSRGSADLTPSAARVTNATVVLVAPDEHGDARGGAIGTGAVVAVGAGRVLVVTCRHVAMPYVAVGAFSDAASARPVWAQLADGREAPGRILWTAEPPLDVALVEVLLGDPPEPVALSSDTDGIGPDEAVFFVPNPYRRGFRVDRGKVLRREVHDTPAGRYSLLFTDLPVQPGDSGSGLFDARGRLIGLNTWTSAGPLGPQGISLPAEAMAEVARVMPATARRAVDPFQETPR